MFKFFTLKQLRVDVFAICILLAITANFLSFCIFQIPYIISLIDVPARKSDPLFYENILRKDDL